MDMTGCISLIGLLLLMHQPFGYTNSITLGENNNDKHENIYNDNMMLRDSDKTHLNINNKNMHNNNNNNNNFNAIADEEEPFIESIDDNSDNMDDSLVINHHNIETSTISGDLTLNLNDQVHLLTKQLNALMMRRREDYKLLENNLRKSLRKNTLNNVANVDMDIHNELEHLRREIKEMRASLGNGNKEKLTVEWLTQSIAEMRKELTELQDIASNASKDLNRRSETFEDMATIKTDFQQFKLELEALKERQQTSEVFIRELREEAVQKEEDFRRLLIQHNDETNSKSMTSDYVEPEADHKMRHQRFIRQQIHELDMSQRHLKKQLNELQYHRIGDRVRSLEIEQRRLANANFNLSRQIASLDKLHSSMLELLEDVGSIQTKVDKTIPDIKREISKLEFTSAQLNSEQSLIREEGHNSAKSLQAMAVSVSALQDERDNIKDLPFALKKLQENVERLESVTMAQKSIVHRRIEKMEMEAKPFQHQQTNANRTNDEKTDLANKLVEQLESVELQYESIINKLPADCSQVEVQTSPNGGLYLIAPAGQHRPTMAHCDSGGWTSIQRRYDGSVDFNRSWESYGQGFGSPAGEFWIGNEMLHHLTADNCTELKIIMQDIYDNTWYAFYRYFYISSRDDGYRLHISGYSGNASDALDYQNRMQFSAIDDDRDISNTHCAANYEGGWWFSHCQHANLNGRYNLGLTWFDASRNEWIAVKSSQMMITKRQQCYQHADDNNVIVVPTNNVKLDKNKLSIDKKNNNNNNKNVNLIRTTTTITSVV